MPIGTKIPGSGPGTGPMLPAALYSLGVNDYAHRWASERIALPVGATMTEWPDASANPVPLAGSNPALQVASDAGFKYLKKVSGSAGAAMIAANAIGGVQIAQTIVAVAVADPTNAAGGTRNVLGVPFGQLGRASNGAWQAAFSGGYAGVSGQGATDAGWEFVAIAHDAGASLANEGFTAQRASGQRRTLSSGTAAAVTATRDINIYGNVSALEFGILEIVVWNRRLSDAELNTVRAAMQAKYPQF